MKDFFACISVILLPTLCFSQNSNNCDMTLPQETWSGYTVKNQGGFTGNSKSISISLQSNNNYLISDFSAGFLEAMGYGSNNPVTIQIDCDHSILASELDTKFGTLSIIQGNWNPSLKQLTLDWSLIDHDLVEQSIFKSE